MGITYVQLWVGEESTDNVNNWDYCVTFMEIQDNLGACTGSKSSIGGKVATSQNVPVDNVELTLNTGANAMTKRWSIQLRRFEFRSGLYRNSLQK
ncbi:MAG: hypothetical protein R2769_02515 [Saprospiraceae bacterium]